MDGASQAMCGLYEPEELGAACRFAVLASWTEKDFLSRSRDFSQRFASRFGLKGEKGLYPGMRHVIVSYRSGSITFSPMRNRRGGNFDAFAGHWVGKEDVVVSFEADDRALGLAALEALDRSV